MPVCPVMISVPIWTVRCLAWRGGPLPTGSTSRRWLRRWVLVSSRKRPKLARVLSDPCATVVVVEHRDRLARFGVELLVALAAHGRRIVIVDAGETADDLVRDMVEVLTSMCARLYGRRGARNRAIRAVTATKEPEPAETVG